MKKLLGILVLGLMLISIDLSNPTRVEAEVCTWCVTKDQKLDCLFGKGVWKNKHCTLPDTRGFFKKQWDKLDDLNPVTYFEKRKECKEEADRADTVYEGKQRYKSCMDD